MSEMDGSVRPLDLWCYCVRADESQQSEKQRNNVTRVYTSLPMFVSSKSTRLGINLIPADGQAWRRIETKYLHARLSSTTNCERRIAVAIAAQQLYSDPYRIGDSRTSRICRGTENPGGVLALGFKSQTVLPATASHGLPSRRPGRAKSSRNLRKAMPNMLR